MRGVRSSVSDVAVLECAGSGQARPGHPPSLSTPAAPVREGGPGGRGREEGGGGGGQVRAREQSGLHWSLLWPPLGRPRPPSAWRSSESNNKYEELEMS